jgi:hypothetical protein
MIYSWFNRIQLYVLVESTFHFFRFEFLRNVKVICFFSFNFDIFSCIFGHHTEIIFSFIRILIDKSILCENDSELCSGESVFI